MQRLAGRLVRCLYTFGSLLDFSESTAKSTFWYFIKAGMYILSGVSTQKVPVFERLPPSSEFWRLQIRSNGLSWRFYLPWNVGIAHITCVTLGCTVADLSNLRLSHSDPTINHMMRSSDASLLNIYGLQQIRKICSGHDGVSDSSWVPAQRSSNCQI